jgi:lysozyme family protein
MGQSLPSDPHRSGTNDHGDAVTKPFSSYERGYAAMWAKAELPAASKAATLATARNIWTPPAIDRYLTAAAATGVPALLIAALNYRESGARFDRYLGNGDPLDKVSVNVPAGRGPFRTWHDGAIDALAPMQRPADGIWSIPFMLYVAENYNGRGYEKHNENSPYIWAQTNLEQPGLFVRDHQFDPKGDDARPGVAALFLAFTTIAPHLLPTETPPAPGATMTQLQPVTKADPLEPLINILDEVKGALPMFAAFVPPPFNMILTIGVPALEDILKFLETTRAQGVTQPSLADFLDKIKTHIEAMNAQLRKP